MPPTPSGLPAARRTDPATSHAAAVAAKRLAREHAHKIVTALRLGPATIYGLAERTGLNHVQVARRMKELQADNRVRRQRVGDKNVTQPSPNGCPCCVWEIVP